MRLNKVDLFCPLELKPGVYLCHTDITDFPWAILEAENIKAIIESDMEPGILEAYGPLPHTED